MDGATSITESWGLPGRALCLTSITLTSDGGTAVILIPAGRLGCLNCLLLGAVNVSGGLGEDLSSHSSTTSSSPTYMVEGEAVVVDTSLWRLSGVATAWA